MDTGPGRASQRSINQSAARAAYGGGSRVLRTLKCPEMWTRKRAVFWCGGATHFAEHWEFAPHPLRVGLFGGIGWQPLDTIGGGRYTALTPNRPPEVVAKPDAGTVELPSVFVFTSKYPPNRPTLNGTHVGPSIDF